MALQSICRLAPLRYQYMVSAHSADDFQFGSGRIYETMT